MPTSFAPGARVEIRDAEWVIRKAEMTPNGQALHVTGLSDPVKDRSAIFLSDLEDIRILRPEDTELVPDRRRTRVVGNFPDGNSALMLVAARLRHVASTKWGTRKYMDMERLYALERDKEVGSLPLSV